MKRIRPTLSLLLLACVNTAFAAKTELDFVESQARQLDYAEQHQQLVWPGFHPAKTSALIEFGKDNLDGPSPAYAFNFTPGKLPWQKVASNYSIYYLPDTSDLKIDGKIEHTFAPIDGQSTFIHIEDPDYDVLETYGSKLLLERAFYYLRYESEIDPKRADYLKSPYDNFNDPSMLKLFYLEDAALTSAQQPDSGRAEEALRDAAAIRQYRNHLSSQSAREYENGTEIMNGIPTYIMWNSRALSEDDYRKMTQRTGCMPLSTMDGPMGLANCVNAGLPAFASSVYGHALDKKLAGQNWKQTVEKQFKSISQMALDYYHMSDDQARLIAEQAMKKPEYQYDRIVRVVDATMTPYLQAMQVAKEKDQALSGVELRVNIALGSVILMLGGMADIYEDAFLLNSHNVMLTDVNLKLDSDSNAGQSKDGVLWIDHLPFMHLQTVTKDFDIDDESSYTSMKLDEHAELIIDDVKTTVGTFVKARKSQEFHKVVLADPHFHIEVNTSGKLDATDGVLKWIDFDDADKAFSQQKFARKLLRQYHVDLKKAQERLRQSGLNLAL